MEKELNQAVQLHAAYSRGTRGEPPTPPAPGKLFNDRTFNDRTFNDQTFNDQAFNDQTSNDQTFNDQTFNDRTFNDQTFNEPEPEISKIGSSSNPAIQKVRITLVS